MNNRAFAPITVLVVLSILFIGFYVAMKPYGLLYNRFTDNSSYVGLLTEEACDTEDGFWEDSECKPLPQRALDFMDSSRRIWLITPIIVAIGMIIWLITVMTRKDPQEYYR